MFRFKVSPVDAILSYDTAMSYKKGLSVTKFLIDILIFVLSTTASEFCPCLSSSIPRFPGVYSLPN